MKYLIDDYKNIVIFSPTQYHSDAKRLMRGEIIGAGFCKLNKNGITEAWGESVSVGIKSNGEEDAKILHEKLSMGQYS